MMELFLLLGLLGVTGFLALLLLRHSRLCLVLFLFAAVVAGMQTTANFVLTRIDVVLLAHIDERFKFQAKRKLSRTTVSGIACRPVY